MKKKIIIGLLAVMVLSFSACGEDDEDLEYYAEDEYYEDEDDYYPEEDEEEYIIEEEEEEPEEEAEETEETEAESDTEDESDQVSETAEDEDDSKKDGPVGSVLCFTGVDLDGYPVDMTDIFSENKVTMLNIWASWCGPCQNEMADLEKMNTELKKEGCAVVGLLADGEEEEGLSDGKTVLSDKGVTYKNVVLPGHIQKELDLEGYPTTYFVDSDGNILGERIEGAAPAEYAERMEELLNDM